MNQSFFSKLKSIAVYIFGGNIKDPIQPKPWKESCPICGEIIHFYDHAELQSPEEESSDSFQCNNKCSYVQITYGYDFTDLYLFLRLPNESFHVLFDSQKHIIEFPMRVFKPLKVGEKNYVFLPISQLTTPSLTYLYSLSAQVKEAELFQ